MTILPLVLLSVLGAGQILDTFQYADAQAARESWKAGEGTPPVEVLHEDGRPVLKLLAPFAADAKLSRAVMDRQVRLDLSAPGEFTLQLVVDPPQAAGQLSLYFRSGGGWYAAGGSPGKRGWQTLRFSKAAFRPEGTPAGWDKIDGIRIAAWRGRAIDGAIRLGELVAVSHDVALVIPAKAARRGDGEVDTALRTAELVAEMLADLGLGSDAIEDASVARGALGKRRVAILAYNPQLSDEAAAALERFVESGGKLLVCYTLPPRLGPALGFGNAKHVRPEQPGAFSEIRFDATDIPGLPKSVRQASWNITAVEPAGHNARVIGRWYDDAGKPAGHPAMLLSDRGALLSHIILSDDYTGKQQLLAAVLGHFSPELWQQVARSSLDRAEKVGHCENLSEASKLISASGNPAALASLRAASDARAQAEKQLAALAYPDAVAMARKSRDLLADAYLRAQPSPRREGRAMWNHSGTGAYPGDWDRTAKELAAAGLNMVFPNMLWAGQAHYPSDVLPRSKTFAEHGDQIQQCVAAAKRHGLEVHVWKVNYNLSGAPREFVEKLRGEGRLQVTFKGQTQEWLCPSHPDNQKLELESMLEVARKYPVHGLHFDYIRYPGRETCYCDGCRARFEAQSGRKLTDWPAECYSGARREEFNTWRCRQITSLVTAVRREAKKLRPELKISAAVFGGYPACRDNVAQDWPEWIKAGLLDFVCPMDYTESDLEFANLVANQLKLVDGRIPVYPGIGATASRSALSVDRVVGQVQQARTLGTAGFTIFNLDRGTAQSLLPGIALGVGSQRATPAHAGK